MTFSAEDRLTALAVVNIFETSKPFGNFTAFAVLDDGAGVSYGINQFTHRSGSLLAVVEDYLAAGGVVGRSVLENAVPLLERHDSSAIGAVAGSRMFEKALKAAAITSEMRAAQVSAANRLYLIPAVAGCDEVGLSLPLSLAVVYDSIVHGSWPAIRDAVKLCRPAKCGGEKEWVTAYVRKRHAWLMSSPRLAKTAYRTRFFLEQIMRGSWDLRPPFRVNGYLLTQAMVDQAAAPKDSAAEPAANSSVSAPSDDGNLSEASPQGRAAVPSSQNAQPPNDTSPHIFRSRDGADILDRVEKSVNRAAREYDRVDAIVQTIVTRKDAAKSLWATIVGTVWQTVWALVGFVYDIPRPIWLAAAVLTGALALAYLYRQITLAKIREHAAGPELRNKQ
ncbi:MAG TPA: chitosanase [Pyrinomonadaceae bacterium]|nr:chitosanase [Pyrinomonadaceae bacterium]